MTQPLWLPKLERRTEPLRWGYPAVIGQALLAAGVMTTILLLVSGYNPLNTYDSMFTTAVTKAGAVSATLTAATPLVFTGLAAAIAFKARIYNIGGEGQLYIGATCAAAAGIAFGGDGAVVAIPAVMLAGILGGALWAFVPGILRSHLSTNEILTTLMLNYVAGLLMYYLIFDSTSYLRDTSTATARAFPAGKVIGSSSFWPGFTGSGVTVPLGFIVGCVLAIALFTIVRRTKFGFEVRVIADSPGAARYAGMRTRLLVIKVMLISGALAGLAGASQIGDVSHQLAPVGLESALFGYAGIVVAALARFNAIGVIPAALFLGGLTNAGFQLEGPKFPNGLTSMIEGLILLCVLAAGLLTSYRIALPAIASVRRRSRGAIPPPERAHATTSAPEVSATSAPHGGALASADEKTTTATEGQ